MENRAQWAIEADEACAREGHRSIIDGRCVRCRQQVDSPTYDPGQRERPYREARAKCPYYTTDQGCPLHGETCRR